MGPRKVFRGLVAARDAVAMVEFAISLPFLALLYVGGYQICDAVSAYRKVTRATRTIADLTSQYTSVDEQDVSEILASSNQVMAPYPTANATMTVTQVRISSVGYPTVDWSRGLNAQGLPAGTFFNLPVSIRQPGTYLIVAQIRYGYRPLFGTSYLGDIPLSETIIMSPRASAYVAMQQ